MTRLSSCLQNILQNGDFRGIINSVGIKAASVISAFVLFLLAARLLDDDVFGRFTILFSLASMLAVFAAFGQEMLIIRLWNQYGANRQYNLLKGIIRFGCIVTFAGGVLFALGLAFYLIFIQSSSPVFSVAVFVLALTLILFSSHLCRAIVGVVVGDGHRDVTAFLPVNIFLLIAMVFGTAISLELIFILLATGCFIALAFQLKAMQGGIKRVPFGSFEGHAKYDIKGWLPPSFRLWIVTILEASNQYLEVILIGFFLNPAAAGIYFVATRLANAFSTAADAFNMFGSKHIPDLFYRKEHDALSSLLRTMAIMTALVIVGGLAFFAIGGELVLGLFSKSYGEYYGVLMILCIGTAALAATGPATQMLMLTGHEGRYLKIMAASVFLRVLGFYVLIPMFGIQGAAFANAFSLVFIAAFVLVSTKLLTGYDPSILRLLSPSSEKNPKSAEV